MQSSFGSLFWMIQIKEIEESKCAFDLRIFLFIDVFTWILLVKDDFEIVFCYKRSSLFLCDFSFLTWNSKSDVRARGKCVLLLAKGCYTDTNSFNSCTSGVGG